MYVFVFVCYTVCTIMIVVYVFVFCYVLVVHVCSLNQEKAAMLTGLSLKLQIKHASCEY